VGEGVGAAGEGAVSREMFDSNAIGYTESSTRHPLLPAARAEASPKASKT
jgi:hypothetical protein